MALPLQSADVHDLCILEPFFSASKLLVTPIVALLSNPSILKGLRASEGEVSQIFDHLLEAILDPSLAETEPLVPVGSDDWPYETSFYVSPPLFIISGTNVHLQVER